MKLFLFHINLSLHSLLFTIILLNAIHCNITFRCMRIVINIAYVTIDSAKSVLVQISAYVLITLLGWEHYVTSHSMSLLHKMLINIEFPRLFTFRTLFTNILLGVNLIKVVWWYLWIWGFGRHVLYIDLWIILRLILSEIFTLSLMKFASLIEISNNRWGAWLIILFSW